MTGDTGALLHTAARSGIRVGEKAANDDDVRAATRLGNRPV